MSTPRLECFDCMAAATDPHHGFTEGCKGCAARSAARSPQYRKALNTGMQDRAYRALLEQYGVTHERVKAAHVADAINGQEERTR